jgi:hypothetical protein
MSHLNRMSAPRSVPFLLAVSPVAVAVAVAVTAMTSCGPFELSPPPGQTDSSATTPDTSAIAAVVKAVYASQGQQRKVVFLSAEEGEGDAIAQVRELVQNDLGIPVRPESEADRTDLSLAALTPKWPANGEIGISISVSLSRFSFDGEGLHVDVSFARSGLDAARFEYVLAQIDGVWTVVESIPIGIA